MFEIFLAYISITGFIIFIIQCFILDIEDKWSCLNNTSKQYFLTVSYIRFLINRESLYVDKEVFDNVLSIPDSLNTKILFILYLLSLIGTLHILIQIVREYYIARVEIITNGNKCS